MKKYTKKYIGKCYDCDKSVGGAYNEQDKTVRKALNQAEIEIGRKQVSCNIGNERKAIIDAAYDILKEAE